MDTLTTILERRSIRKYRTAPIPDEDLRQILEACRQAPSAGNRQPWHFVVVGDPDHKVAQACRGQLWMHDAPTPSCRGCRRPRALVPVDVAIAMRTWCSPRARWVMAPAGSALARTAHALCDLPEERGGGLYAARCRTPARAARRAGWDEVFSRDRYEASRPAAGGGGPERGGGDMAAIERREAWAPVPFNQERITNAIYRAAVAVGGATVLPLSA